MLNYEPSLMLFFESELSSAPFSVLHVEFKTDLVLGRAEELREKITCHGPIEWGRKTHRFGESCVTFASLSPFHPRCPSHITDPRP